MRLPPPRLDDFKQDVELTAEQCLAVLKWAAQWAGHSTYPVRDLLPELDAIFRGAIGRRDKSPAYEILRVAYAHIASERSLNSLLRNNRAFPYAQLRLMESPGHGCAAARAMSDRVIRSNNCCSLPLSNCETIFCSCRWTFFTQGQVDRGEVKI